MSGSNRRRRPRSPGLHFVAEHEKAWIVKHSPQTLHEYKRKACAPVIVDVGATEVVGVSDATCDEVAVGVLVTVCT